MFELEFRMRAMERWRKSDKEGGRGPMACGWILLFGAGVAAVRVVMHKGLSLQYSTTIMKAAFIPVTKAALQLPCK